MSLTDPVVVERLLYLCYGPQKKKQKAQARKIIEYLKDNGAFSEQTAKSYTELCSVFNLDPGKVVDRNIFGRIIRDMKGIPYDDSGRTKVKTTNFLEIPLIYEKKISRTRYYWLDSKTLEHRLNNLKVQMVDFLRG